MTEEELQPWPEDPLPPDLSPVEFTALADHMSRVIWGEGNPKAPLMVRITPDPGRIGRKSL